jgi:putative flippase GtrA
MNATAALTERQPPDTGAGVAGGPRGRLVEVVVPVYNEQHVLEASVRRLHRYLAENLPYPFRITVADNASTDHTWAVAARLARELSGVRAVHLDLKGRGRALRAVWSASDADIVAYMDVDLSTDLNAFLPLVAPLLSGHSDLAIGSRLARGSAVSRGPKREFISRTYNFLLRTTMAARFSDAQCGFKAAKTEVVQALLPRVQDDEWFFDTELLLLAERSGLRIHEVPVDWIDDPDSRVDIVKTAKADLKGMWRVAKSSMNSSPGVPVRARVRAADPPPGLKWQVPVFATIGVVSTLAYLLLYVILAAPMGAFAANAAALAVTAVANTAANRRFTFGVTGTRNALRDQVGGLVAFAIGLVLSTGTLAAVHAAVQHPSRITELAALIVANGLSTLARFVVLRAWVFHPRHHPRASADHETTVSAAQSTGELS